MKTAAAYIRVSTDDQIEYSPASQLEKIREYAKRNDYILPQEYIFIDEGISGRHTAKRAAFNRMIGTAKQKPKPFDAILLWKFSRFARNREDSIVYKSMLRKQCKIDVISISENTGDDKMSVLIEAMIEAMDEYYSINLSEEVKRGMNEKASRGEALTIPSFGYTIRKGVYIPDPDTAPLVRQIFSDFLSGVPVRTIATKLNDNGCRTRRGNPFENRTVKYILQNPVYVGKMRWNPDGKTDYTGAAADTNVIPAHHEPIIDMKTWDETQKKIKGSPRTKYMRSGDPKEPFMLQGLCRCSACGATLTRATSSGVQCYAYAHGKCKKSHSISIKKLNAAVIDALRISGVDGDLKINPISRQKKPETENYAAQIAKEKKKLDRIRDAYESEAYTLSEFKTARQKILDRIAHLEQQQAATPEAVPDVHKLRSRIMSILPSLTSPAVPESTKNQLLKSIIERIVFYRSTCDIEIYFYT